MIFVHEYWFLISFFQCLSVLNYFRSLERTLTINDGGLSLEGKNQKKGR